MLALDREALPPEILHAPAVSIFIPGQRIRIFISALSGRWHCDEARSNVASIFAFSNMQLCKQALATVVRQPPTAVGIPRWSLSVMFILLNVQVQIDSATSVAADEHSHRLMRFLLGSIHKFCLPPIHLMVLQ